MEAFLVLIPALPLAAAAAAASGWSGKRAGGLSLACACAAVVTALGALAALAGWGAATWHAAPWGRDALPAFALRLDPLSAVMALLVAVLGAVVIRFSRNYLAGDAGQGRFFGWMNGTLASVLLLVLSGNFQVLWLAWVATSLCLHQLLVYYPWRAPAVFSARKKFVISRLGDLCLLGALIVIYRAYGTLDYDSLFAAVEAGKTEGLAPAGWLLAACAMFKSAQFPFHGWLPDTMETPTPVSALMHAGIINAGGFLIIRFSPLMAHVPPAMAFLALLGAVTAAFGAVVMLTQPSVKRALAFSTVAQMGFMLLQCGLGAFGLALLHLVAHSLYKAHAFLHAGSTVGAPARAAVPLRGGNLAVGLAGGLGVTALGLGMLGGTDPLAAPSVFILVLALALGYGIARAGASGAGTLGLAGAGLMAMIVGALALGLHKLALAFPGGFPDAAPPLWLMGLVALVFCGLFLLQSLVWRANQSGLGRRLYVHALNGFYLGTLGNRLLNTLWPSELAPRPLVSRTAESPTPNPLTPETGALT